MDTHVELSLLRSFLKVADEGNITRAAASMHLSQPAVTQHIASLERIFGAVLLERTGRGVELTGAGKILADYAKRMISTLEEAHQVILEHEKGITGRLVIGAGTTTSIFVLPAWLTRFRASHPGVDIVVRTGRSKEVAELTLGREADLGMVTSAVRHPGLTSVDLLEERIVLVCPSDHHLSGQTVPAARLESCALILFPEGTGFRAYLDGVLRQVGISMRVKMETDSVEAIKSFVAVGLGVSFLPSSAVAREVDSGALGTISITDIPALTRRTSVIYRNDRYLSAAARAFLCILPRLSASQPEGPQACSVTRS